MHDLHTGVFTTRQRDANGSFVMGLVLSSRHHVSWVFPPDLHVTLDQAEVRMVVEGDEGEDDMRPPSNVICKALAGDADAEDSWDP